MFQAANLVDRLATHGQIPVSAAGVLADSLFIFDSSSAVDIYAQAEQILTGSADQQADGASPDITQNRSQSLSQNLSAGFRVAKQIFGENKTREYPQTIRYVMSLIKLEKQFSKNNAIQTKVRNGLISIADKKSTLSEKELAAELSKLYVETLANMPFRIQVLGKMQYLQNIDNEQQVRLLLLAGIRATMLWRQLGGRPWHFIFYKRHIANTLQQASAS
jgi:high frequency lysogenization protein